MKKTISFIFLSFIFFHSNFLLNSDDEAELFNISILKNNGNPWQALKAMQKTSERATLLNINSIVIEYGENYIKKLKYHILSLRALQAAHCFNDIKADEFIEKIQNKTLNINDIKRLKSEIKKSNKLLESVEAKKEALLKSNNGNLTISRSDALVNKYNPKETENNRIIFDIILKQLDEEIKSQQSNF